MSGWCVHLVGKQSKDKTRKNLQQTNNAGSKQDRDKSATRSEDKTGMKSRYRMLEIPNFKQIVNAHLQYGFRILLSLHLESTFLY